MPLLETAAVALHLDEGLSSLCAAEGIPFSRQSSCPEDGK